MKIVRASLLIALCFAMSLKICEGQATSFGTIVGYVHDQSGAAVSNAPIEVRNTATGIVTKTRTQSDGNYTAINLVPGTYVVSVEVSGFAKSVTTPTQLVVNQTLRLDLVLRPGAVTQTVQVSAQGTLIDTDSSTVSQEVSQREVADLPLASRNFMDLTVLSPATVADTGGTLGGDQHVYRTSLAGGSVFVGGGRGSSNEYLIDGVANNDPGFETPTITPSIDAIQDFRLMDKDYSAEFSGAASQINIATKSGTNSFHGTLYDFFRNDDLDATDGFSAGLKPVLRYNLFGVTGGGPVWIPHVINGRDRLFFFASYEGNPQHSVANILGVYPTQQELSGNFAGDPTITNPATGLPFSGNQITSIDPKAAEIIKDGLVPTANSSGTVGYNTTAALLVPNKVNQYLIRIDAHLGPKNSLFARWAASDQNVTSPTINPLGGTIEQQIGKNVAVDYTHIFTSNFINDLRFGLNRPISIAAQQGASTDNVAGSLFAGTDPDAVTWGAPLFDLNGYGEIGGNPNGPLDYTTTDATLTDMITWIHGPHTIQAGLDADHIFYKEVNQYEPRGILEFTGLFTGNPLADFLLGDAYSASVAQGNATGWFNTWGEGGFVQDNWKIGTKLTVNLGFRYDYNSPLREEHNLISTFDASYPGGRLDTPNQSYVTLVNTPLIAYTPARDITAPDKTEFQPRIGFSYRPFGNTVIRSGYGIYYDASEWNEYVFPILNPPFEKTAALQATSSTLPDPAYMDNLFPIAPTPTPIAGTMSSLTLDPDNSRTPYVQQWNLDIEHEMRGNMVVEIGYLGSEGTHLQDRRVTTQGQLVTPGATPVINFPYTNFAFILQSQDATSSNYNALIARFGKHFSKGFSLDANYTYAKAMGTQSSVDNLGTNGAYGFQNNWNVRGDYGPLSYDVTQRFVFSPIWELPFGRGRLLGGNAPAVANALIGGWQVEGIFQAQTGYPFAILALYDNSGTGSFNPRASLVSGQNPFGPPSGPGVAFNTNAFTEPAVGTFGNTANNMMRGLGYNNSDFSLIKDTVIHESLSAQLRVEAFNVFNQSDIGPLPNETDMTPTFGAYDTLSHEARILQLGLKIIY